MGSSGKEPIAGSSPLQVFRSTGNIALTTVASTWTDTDPDGTANARPLDLVISDVRAGDWVTVQPSYYSPSTATNISQDIAVMVAGAVVHTFGGQMAGGTGGITGWFVTTGVIGQGGPAISYQVQADDIEGGSIRLRHRHLNSSTTARTISAAGNNRFVLEGRGPFR